MDSTSKFEKAFINILEEDTSTGGALGTSEGGFDPAVNINSSDFYARGSARVPKGGKTIQRRSGIPTILKRKRSKKKSKKRKRVINTSL
jgi:hypothetical protein